MYRSYAPSTFVIRWSPINPVMLFIIYPRKRNANAHDRCNYLTLRQRRCQHTDCDAGTSVQPEAQNRHIVFSHRHRATRQPGQVALPQSPPRQRLKTPTMAKNFPKIIIPSETRRCEYQLVSSAVPLFAMERMVRIGTAINMINEIARKCVRHIRISRPQIIR